MKSLTALLCLVAIAISCAAATPSDDDGRIVNGIAIKINQAPYMVRLLYRGNFFFCGGSLIASNYVLTAGHCLNNRDPSQITVVANVTYSYEQGIRRKPIRWAVHPGYNNRTFISDVAVLQLDAPIEGMGTLRLCQHSVKEGDTVQVSGWGYVAEKAASSGALLTAFVPVRSMEVCRDQYHDLVKQDMFCASGIKDVGFCNGDSGGPAVVDNQVCGIVAFSTKCGEAGYTEAYTNVYDVRAFIVNFMWSNWV